MGLWEHLERRGVAYSNTGAPKVPFSAKMTKMPLVNPRFDRRSNEVKALKKQHFFLWFYIKPELLGEFLQLWLSLTRSRSWVGPKTLIFIQMSEQVETNAIANIIKFSF